MTAKAKTLRSEQKDATREQILTAATKLLSERGYAAFRVAAVANEAGVSLGGQLHHFPSKESLILAVLERLSERVLEMAVREAARSEEDTLAPISGSAERFYAAPEFLIYLDIFLSFRRDAQVSDTGAKLEHSFRTAIERQWLPHLTDRGIGEEDAAMIVQSLWALSRGLALSPPTSQSKARKQATLDFVIKALRQTYVGSGASGSRKSSAAQPRAQVARRPRSVTKK